MPLATIRKMTDEDYGRLEAAAKRFAAKHGIDVSWPSPETKNPALFAVEQRVYDKPQGEADYETAERKRLARLWLACFRRAVRHPSADSHGYGYLGYDAP